MRVQLRASSVRASSVRVRDKSVRVQCVRVRLRKVLPVDVLDLCREPITVMVTKISVESADLAAERIGVATELDDVASGRTLATYVCPLRVVELALVDDRLGTFLELLNGEVVRRDANECVYARAPP